VFTSVHATDPTFDINYMLTRTFFPSSHFSTLLKLTRQRAITLSIAATFVETFITEFHKQLWIPRCDKVKEWERSHNITNCILRQKLTHRITYKKTDETLIEGERYDSQRRKILSFTDQWNMALQEGRKTIKNYVQYGVQHFGKVKKGLKSVSFDFFSFYANK